MLDPFEYVSFWLAFLLLILAGVLDPSLPVRIGLIVSAGVLFVPWTMGRSQILEFLLAPVLGTVGILLMALFALLLNVAVALLLIVFCGWLVLMAIWAVTRSAVRKSRAFVVAR